jgi:hypothetical protein
VNEALANHFCSLAVREARQPHRTRRWCAHLPSPRRTLACFSFLSFLAGSSAFAQLDRAFEAHGGIAKWKNFASVEFNQTWTSAKGVKKDHQLFDLRQPDGLITSARRSARAKVKSGSSRPSTRSAARPRASTCGRRSSSPIRAVKVTFKKGSGDSSEDYYIAYLDPKSGQMKLVSYVVTYAALWKDKPMDQLEPHALVFEEWQDANGLRVPKRDRFYNWKNESIEGEPLGVMEFSNVNFSETAPDAAKFAKPADAVIAPL